MTYLVDPQRTWEKEWELANPEPHPEPTFVDENDHLVWRTHETIARVEWHKQRWEAFKQAYPGWKEIGGDDETETQQ